jgi:hypothetical protein
MKLRVLFIVLVSQIFILSAAPRGDWESGGFVLLDSTDRKPARTAVLIMTSPDIPNTYKTCRWELGKKVWEQYMNIHPNVDCFFLQNIKLRKLTSEKTWIEGNTIYVSDELYQSYGHASRTIAAIEKLLPNYTHFFRTNVTAFLNLKKLNEYAETHYQSLYTGPLWQEAWYVFGYGILFSADVATHMVNEYRRLKDSYVLSFDRHFPEDATLASLATGIFPYYDYIGHVKGTPEFNCCPTLPFGIRQLMCESSFSATRLSQYGVLLFPPPSFEQAINYCSQALNSAILYRIRGGFDLDKLAELYEYLLNNIYPELPKFDLVEYSKSLTEIRYDNS